MGANDDKKNLNPGTASRLAQVLHPHRGRAVYALPEVKEYSWVMISLICSARRKTG